MEEDLTAALARQTELGETVNACKETLAKAKEAVEAHRNADAGYALRLQCPGGAAAISLTEGAGRPAHRAADRPLPGARCSPELQRDYEGFSKAVRLVMQEAQERPPGPRSTAPCLVLASAPRMPIPSP